MRTIPTEDLRPGDVPGPDAGWGEISKFAHTLDGYAAANSFDRCAAIASCRPETLVEMRIALFWEARANRHASLGTDPDGEHAAHIRGLEARIREAVSRRA